MSGGLPWPRLEALSETVLLVRFGEGIDPAINLRVHAAAAALHAAVLPGLVELVPAYASLALHHEPHHWAGPDGDAPGRLATAVREVLAAASLDTAAESALQDIPVCYGGDFGPDLEAVAAQLGLAPAELVARHAAAEYRVAMLGFAPGFPYLLGLDPALAVPRRASPRLRVPAGSVAIGGAQTGIYPAELPGGWQLLGRTPLRLFDPAREKPCLLAASERVRFRPITSEEFGALEGR